MLECVVNVAEGRRTDVVGALVRAAGADLLDVHTDPHHHRTVLTLVGEQAPRAVTSEAVSRIDIGAHEGAHPRMGAVDVVPFVPIAGSTMPEAVGARDAFAAWAGGNLDLPCFLYGRERTLPEIRSTAFDPLRPDSGPATPHPTAGATAVGARPPLVAYNIWLAEPDLAQARSLAAALRSKRVRALGLAVGDQVQVSINLLDPDVVGPDTVFDAVAAEVNIGRTELVGLTPTSTLEAIDPARWDELDLSRERTIESRLGSLGTD